MAVGRISGPLLKSNLLRQGIDLAFENDLLYLDVNNQRIGIKTDSPTHELDIFGTSKTTNLIADNIVVNDIEIDNSTIKTETGDLTLQGATAFDKVSIPRVTIPDVQGDTLLTGNFETTGNIHAQGNITAAGDITIGDENTDNITFNSFINSDLIPDQDSTELYNLGSQIQPWNELWVNSINITSGGPSLQGVTAADIELGLPNDSVWTDGAYIFFQPEQNVATAIDDLNEVINNIRSGTFVRSAEITASDTNAEIGTEIFLDIQVDGNANEFDVNWGDGLIETGLSTSTPSHVYNDASGSPYTVTVIAKNTNAQGSGSQADIVVQDFINIFPSNPVPDADFYRTETSSNSLGPLEFYVIEGNSLFLKNKTTNTQGASVSYTINWGDGSQPEVISNDTDSGGVFGDRLGHIWQIGSSTGSGTQLIQLTLDSHSTANPEVIPTTTDFDLKVYSASPTEPNGLDSKQLSLLSTVGELSRLVSGFTQNLSQSSLAPGDVVSRIDSTLSVTETNVLGTFSFDADAGTLAALINEQTNGEIILDSNDNSGTSGSLTITEESDYHLLNVNGDSVPFLQSIYPPGLFKGFKAKISKNTSTLPIGLNSYILDHSIKGSTNTVEFVNDSVIEVPITNVGSIKEKQSGTYRYISGVPYYSSGDPQIETENVTVSNLTGETYLDSLNVTEISSAENLENTSGIVINPATYNYADLEGRESILNNGIPIAGIGVENPYEIAKLPIDIRLNSTRAVGKIDIRSRNTKGQGSSVVFDTPIQVHSSPQQGISEIAISVSANLGDGTITDQGVRIFDFAGNNTDTPVYDGSIDFFTNDPYTENSDPGVAGTQESTVRWGIITHSIEDYSQYLPVGPDRSSDTGRQYFTMAFRRRVVSNFSINLASDTGIAGCWIAIPGTETDETSTLNGWLTTNETYAGAGIPGENASAGGNGSNAVSATSGDKIPLNTNINDNYRFTLGPVSLTSATGNVALIRIALDPGQQVTLLEVV